jgi:uncharacterized membrane protein YkgB
MNALTHILAKSGLLTKDLDNHLIRASMVLIFLAFGYQKWFAYEVQILIPYISNGPLIFWLYPVLGLRGASWFLGVSEWTFGALLFLGFWNKQLGILGAIGSTLTFLGTVTIIPFMPDGWDPVAGGFPAMSGNVPFLMKDVGGRHVVKPKGKRGVDPEISATAAAQTPEQVVGVATARRGHCPCVGEHDVASQQAVAGQATVGGREAPAAAQHEAADAHGRAAPGRHREWRSA